MNGDIKKAAIQRSGNTISDEDDGAVVDDTGAVRKGDDARRGSW